MSRLGIVLAAALGLCACMPASAGAAQSARISARFTPERLGAPTAMSVGFQITARGHAPEALRAIRLVYPGNLGLATSGLGLASCSPSELEAAGPEVCPPDSRMGSGSATVEIVLDSGPIKEHVTLALFAAPSTDGYLHVLVYVTGFTPVLGQATLSGVLLPGRLNVLVPPIPSFPEAPGVVLMQMQVTLGGNLTYYEQVDGTNLAYHPPGVGLPSRCPKGGFRFAATFAFMDGSHAKARTAVPCPRGR